MRRFAALLIGLLPGLASAGEQARAYPPLPQAFSSFGAAVADGQVYVYGGHVAKTHTYSTEAVTGKFRRLDLAAPGKGWQELPPGPGLQGLALVAHGGKVIRIGGMQPRNKIGEKADNISVATCAVFDPGLGKWQALPDLPVPRSSHDAIVAGDRLVVVGGWKMNGRGTKAYWHDSALILDLSKKSPAWESIPQPFRRRALNVAVAGDAIFVVGGINSEGDVEKTVDVLDLGKRTWSKAASLPGGSRNGFAPAAVGAHGRIYASPADGKVYRLSEKRDAWEPIAELQQRRIVHRIVPAGPNALLVLGGAGGGRNVDLTEAVRTDGKVLAPAATAEPAPGADGH